MEVALLLYFIHQFAFIKTDNISAGCTVSVSTNTKNEGWGHWSDKRQALSSSTSRRRSTHFVWCLMEAAQPPSERVCVFNNITLEKKSNACVGSNFVLLPGIIWIHYHNADNSPLNESKFNVHCFSLLLVWNDLPNSWSAISPSDKTLASEVRAAK